MNARQTSSGCTKGTTAPERRSTTSIPSSHVIESYALRADIPRTQNRYQAAFVNGLCLLAYLVHDRSEFSGGLKFCKVGIARRIETEIFGNKPTQPSQRLRILAASSVRVGDLQLDCAFIISRYEERFQPIEFFTEFNLIFGRKSLVWREL